LGITSTGFSSSTLSLCDETKTALTKVRLKKIHKLSFPNYQKNTTMTSTSKHSGTAWALVAIFAWTFVEGVLEYLGKSAGNRAA